MREIGILLSVQETKTKLQILILETQAVDILNEARLSRVREEKNTDGKILDRQHITRIQGNEGGIFMISERPIICKTHSSIQIDTTG